MGSNGRTPLSSKILEYMQDYQMSYPQAVQQINDNLRDQNIRFNPTTRQVEALR
jgi:hypothetical protein